MSVVVAIKDNNKVFMSCDSQVTIGGYTKRTLSNKNNYKIFKPTKDIVIGVVGQLRHLNLLYCVEDYIDELTRLKDAVDFKYIVTKVVPNIIKLFKDNNATIDKNTSVISSIVLFAYKNQLYRIGCDGAVIEIDDYIATGSGEDLSLGYLNQAKFEYIEKDSIEAVKVSCLSSLHVNFPIITMNTENDEIIITEN